MLNPFSIRRRTAQAALLLLTGCSLVSAQPARKLAPTDVVASVDGTAITLGQVDDKALQTPTNKFGTTKLVQALYEARRAAITDLVNGMLIDADAKARGLDRAVVVEQEIASKIVQPTDAEVTEWFDANKERLQGATIEQIREPIRMYLRNERTTAVREAYLGRLRNKAAVKVSLDPPRQQVATVGHHSRGPVSAPIQFVEFADFECPFCLRAHPTVKQLLSLYGDKIHFVYRHYPLPNHPRARPAAEASECAAEQGKFWEYYEVLFGGKSALQADDLKAHAATISLDVPQFTACVESHKYKTTIDLDAKEGEEAGVSGTPAFFINGRPLSGALPLEDFKQLIDEELALTASR